MRPGFVSPTVAAKMSNTLDQLTRGRVLINVVTGGFPAELAADGDFMEHDERYARTQEFMQVVRQRLDRAARPGATKARTTEIENGNVFPKPYQQPHPPFYFGGASDAAQEGRARRRRMCTCSGARPCRWSASASPTCASAPQRIGRTLRFGMRIHVIVARDGRGGARRRRATRRRDPGALPRDGATSTIERRRLRGREAPARARREGRTSWLGAEPLDGHRRGAARRRHARSSAPARASPRCLQRVRRRRHRHVHPLRLPAPGGGGALRPVRHAALRRAKPSVPIVPPGARAGARVEPIARRRRLRQPARALEVEDAGRAMLDALARGGCETQLVDVAELPAEALVARATAPDDRRRASPRSAQAQIDRRRVADVPRALHRRAEVRSST